MGVPVRLEPPERLDERWAIWVATVNSDTDDATLHALAGALGLCWKDLREAMASERKVYTPGKLMQFGAEVIHYLMNQRRPERPLPGWSKPTINEIIAAGRAAARIANDSRIGEDEVAEEQAFSAAPTERPHSSSSTSSAVGASGQGGSAPFTRETPPG